VGASHFIPFFVLAGASLVNFGFVDSTLTFSPSLPSSLPFHPLSGNPSTGARPDQLKVDDDT